MDKTPARLSIGLPDYAELHCLSHFSFQRGASSPADLVRRAAALGYRALAITDECSVAGVVRAYEAAREPEVQASGLRLLVGSEFLWGRCRLVALPRDAKAWGDLCEFITAARAGAPKGEYGLGPATDWRLLQGCEMLLAPCRTAMHIPAAAALVELLAPILALCPATWWLAAELHLAPDDSLWLAALQGASRELGIPLVAAGDVHMHQRRCKPLQDVMTAIHLGRPVAACGQALQPNAERHLRSRLRLAGIYPPPLLHATLEVARRCTFRLDEIRYRYPQETVPVGMSPAQALAWYAWEGARAHHAGDVEGVPQAMQDLIHKELALIAHHRYEMYFLTVHDIVRYARSQGILCQGRGSAANSVVCFYLGITAADPRHSHPLFERFISKERDEPPDIDVDFEHERREEVIQYIYGKYGRDRAAITAVVTCYRPRSALRDVGKALGVPPALIDAFAKDHHWFDRNLAQERLQGLAEVLGVPLHPRQAALWLELATELINTPRHLSQHVGGFVLTEGKLTRLVPVEPASMVGRSVIQWDKDDLDVMGLLKVDVLALGMLTALRRCLDARAALRGERWELKHIPPEDPQTYDMICAADTVGVFQIESRAQMSMLPRLRPRTFYDLVVEVAIVRPGPIQGGMVHPYLQARERQRRGEALQLEHKDLYEALERTLGVPIFQEQVMQIAMVAAGFTPGMADDLRRSMAAWKRKGGVHRFEQPLLKGMADRGYSPTFAQSIYQQMLGFGEYGFPESHAYSFALLSYASSWLKCHEPACFLASLLDSQPMGFYSSSQLVQDARRHGLRVLPIDVQASDWHCRMEGPLHPLREGGAPQPAVRLGLQQVAGLSRAGADRLQHARAQGLFSNTEDLALRAQLDTGDLQALATADALRSLSGHRRQQVWEAMGQRAAPGLLREARVNEAPLILPAAPEGEDILFDYAATGLTLRRHPLALLRERLARRGVRSAMQLQQTDAGGRVRACGIVTVRQRPGTAKGTMFVTLEDETGPVNVIVWPCVLERGRDAVLRARLLAVEGLWQCTRPAEAGAPVVRHLVAQRFRDLTPWLGLLAGVLGGSRDFH